MKIERIITGYLEENCYILTNDDNQVLIIDPGDEAAKIISNIKNREVIGILITHHHMDHIGALNYIENKYNIKELNFEEGTQFIEDFSFEVINKIEKATINIILIGKIIFSQFLSFAFFAQILLDIASDKFIIIFNKL